MLAVVTTDYPLLPGEDRLPRPAVEASFNAISVDGECSTNDAVVLIANGRIGCHPRRRAFPGDAHRRLPTSPARSSPTARAQRWWPRSASPAPRARRRRSDRTAHRHVTAREDRALRHDANWGRGANGRRQRALQRRRSSTPTSSRCTTTTPRYSSPARRRTSSRTSTALSARSTSSLASATARRLPDQRPFVRLRADQRGVSVVNEPAVLAPAVTRLIVKVGGAVAAESADRILGLVEEGHQVCVVHGAGPQITQETAPLDPGRVHRRAGGAPRSQGSRSCGRRWRRSTRSSAPRSATSPSCVRRPRRLLAVPVPPLGQVGDLLPCRPPRILAALDAGLVPVVALLAVGPLNVNADDAAAALALGIGARTLVFLTDVAGLYIDGDVVDEIGVAEGERLLDAGAFEGGIVPKLRAAAIAAGRGVSAHIGLDNGGRMTATAGTQALLPTYARLGVTFVEGDGFVADRRCRPALSRPVRRHRRRRPRPPSPRPARRRARAARPPLARLEPLLDRADAGTGRAPVRALRRRTRVFLQLRRRVDRSRAAARKATGRSEVVSLDGSFHGRTFGALSVTGQPGKRAGFGPLVPGAVFATPDTLADHVGPNTAAILLSEPGPGGGGTKSARGRGAEAGARAGRRARGHADPRRGADGRRDAPAFVLRLVSSSACGPTLSRWRKGSRTACRSACCWSSDDAPTAFEPGDHAVDLRRETPVTCAAARARCRRHDRR